MLVDRRLAVVAGFLVIIMLPGIMIQAIAVHDPSCLNSYGRSTRNRMIANRLLDGKHNVKMHMHIPFSGTEVQYGSRSAQMRHFCLHKTVPANSLLA